MTDHVTDHESTGRVSGLEEFDGERWYTVADVDRMTPFLMSLVSDGDHWMFVSSSGALTVGRGDAGSALFPYVTDDRLHASGGRIGPVTRLRLADGADELLWSPFEDRATSNTRRFVSKSVVGTSVVFEEQRSDLGLAFRYRWASAGRYGFVRTASIRNDGAEPVTIDVLDGLVDVLPFGLEPTLYQTRSNLTNAYKRSELIDPASRLAVYSLESPVSDRASPEEVLRASVVWSIGLGDEIAVGPDAIGRFEAGVDISSSLVTGRPGAYLTCGTVELDPGQQAVWHIVADVALDQADIVDLGHELGTPADVLSEIGRATARTNDRLVEIMASADALQRTNDDVACAHHFSNVTYNVMRGGIPVDGYRIDVADFVDFVGQRNGHVADRHGRWFASLPDPIDRHDLLDRIEALVEETGDVHLRRLGEEYLPFGFSRRHGDPSRPWNQFSIRVVDDDGRPLVHYEGNWRDVFQNWEASCASHPEYLPGVVSTFVNASTADGHNPYRVTREGIDWEKPDPHDPWGNIGYWGDHQIVYLLRLLEATERFLPGELARRLDVRAHTYADVPYRIAPYDALLADSKNTIEFDVVADARVDQRVEEIGGDGRLVVDRDGSIVLVTLAEKLLVPALAKLSNFVPGGGIWMNTQRPEWNDANNALAGQGLSMVTLFHLRRYLDHLRRLTATHDRDVPMSVEVVTWLTSVEDSLGRHDPEARGESPERVRRQLVDRLGRAASDFRTGLYETGLSGELGMVRPQAIVALCDSAIEHLDETIRANRRSDGLVHSYNVVHWPSDDAVTVSHLTEMLEGQVAALSADVLSAEQQADLVDALFDSALVRDDLDTFLLAPAHRPPAFLAKNVIDPQRVSGNPLLVALAASAERSLIRTDARGSVRFAPDLVTESTVIDRLLALATDERWSALVEQHRPDVLDVYESVFRHRSYLGRSGSMYAYEGIGSIYWHMVAKLLLAVQDAVVDADRRGNRDARERLRAAYWRVRAGLGFNKSASEFGAIPIDPYSHTPAHAGAQQPGMTGAVKEEILARGRELGISVVDGQIAFDGLLLRSEESVPVPTDWELDGPDGQTSIVHVPAGATASTLCQVPIVVVVEDGDPSVEIEFADGRTDRQPGQRLTRIDSAAIFRRTGEVKRVLARLPRSPDAR